MDTDGDGRRPSSNDPEYVLWNYDYPYGDFFFYADVVGGFTIGTPQHFNTKGKLKNGDLVVKLTVKQSRKGPPKATGMLAEWPKSGYVEVIDKFHTL